MTSCFKPSSTATLNYYDWTALGTKAPSVVPELDRATATFKINKVRSVPAFESPTVLAPYNLTMKFDTVIEGEINGHKTSIQTAKSLLPENLTAGTTLNLKVGKKNPSLVYELNR